MKIEEIRKITDEYNVDIDSVYERIVDSCAASAKNGGKAIRLYDHYLDAMLSNKTMEKCGRLFLKLRQNGFTVSPFLSIGGAGICFDVSW